MKSPKVSVIMPIFNGEKYIRAAIDSVLNQTFTDFELMLINDYRSKDKSEEISKTYNDPRISFYKITEPIKLAEIRNRAIKDAKGEYIAWLDCDDIALSDRLQKQIEFLDSHPEYGAVCTNNVNINEKDEVISGPVFEKLVYPIEWLMIWGNQIAQSTMTIRKSVLEEYNLFYKNDIDQSEDYELWTRMILKTKIHRLDEVLLHYRVHTTSMYISNKRSALESAINSSRNLASTLTGENTPALHEEFTTFKRYIGDSVKKYNFIKAVNWLEKLGESAQKHWEFNGEEYHLVKVDILQKLKEYFYAYSVIEKIFILANLLIRLKFALALRLLKFQLKILGRDSSMARLKIFVKTLLLKEYPYVAFQLELKRFAKQFKPVSQEITELSKLPEIDIVLLTLNRLKDTKRTLNSLYSTIKSPFRLIIIDQNSTDGTKEFLEEFSKKHSNVDLSFSKQNLGVAGGRSEALKRSKNEFVTFIDNDMVFAPWYFENLVLKLSTSKDLAGVLGKVVFPNKKIQLNYPVFEIDDGVVVFKDIDADKMYNDPSTFEDKECDWLPGVAMWRLEVIKKFQFDPELVGAYEDNELCYRIKKEGYKFRNCPESIVLHISAQFTPDALKDKAYSEGRFDRSKHLAALKRSYKKHGLVFCFGEKEGFARHIGFNSFKEYAALIKS